MQWDFLSKDAVEGVIALKDKGKGKGKGKEKVKAKQSQVGGQDEAEAKYTHCDDNLNIRLTLHALKFINPDGVYAAGTDNDECWIKPTADKPYIAFAMSMGQTERKENLFVAEKDVTSYTSLFYYLGR